MLHPGYEPGSPRPQRGVLTTRLMEHIHIMYWRYRVSIPVPRACKARALPIELYPHHRFNYDTLARYKNIDETTLLTGFEPATTGLEVQCAIHCATRAVNF